MQHGLVACISVVFLVGVRYFLVPQPAPTMDTVQTSSSSFSSSVGQICSLHARLGALNRGMEPPTLFELLDLDPSDGSFFTANLFPGHAGHLHVRERLINSFRHAAGPDLERLRLHLDLHKDRDRERDRDKDKDLHSDRHSPLLTGNEMVVERVTIITRAIALLLDDEHRHIYIQTFLPPMTTSPKFYESSASAASRRRRVLQDLCHAHLDSHPQSP